MNILILGNAKDAHARHVFESSRQTGADVEYLDISLFPTRLQLSWNPSEDCGYINFASGRQISLQDIDSVYWRTLNNVGIPKVEDTEQYDIAWCDAKSTVRSLFQACSAHWVNPWQAYQFHQEKPLQLRLAKQLGVTIPATLVSNDPQQITEFVRVYDKVIFKPVSGGSHARYVTSEHLEPKRLTAALKVSPVTLQEYIAGTNIRSYVVGDYVYSAEIRTEAVDFRDDVQAEIIAIATPEDIKQQCKAVASAFSLEWTGIDWRRKPTGEYIFLEANPSPMFIYFEQQTGFPITQKLVELLTS